MKKRILEEIKSDRDFFALRQGKISQPVAVPVTVPKNVDSVTIQVLMLLLIITVFKAPTIYNITNYFSNACMLLSCTDYIYIVNKHLQF